MPPARPARRGHVRDENEDIPSTRMTRAKAAALDVDAVNAQPVKQAIQPKKSTTTAAATKRRAALGDVTNAGKKEVAAGKKPLGLKTGLVSKVAPPTGVQKSTAKNGTRTALKPKEPNVTAVTKRTGSGSGVLANTKPTAIGSSKRKNTTTGALKHEPQSETKESARKKIQIEKEIEKALLLSNEKKKAQTDFELEKCIQAADVKAAKLSALSEIASATKAEVDEYDEDGDSDMHVGPEPHPEHVYPEGVKDLDMEDAEDPLMASEYVIDIFEYLRQLEPQSLPVSDYMEHQDELGWKMRGILVDWLIEVHTRFHLLPETLFLAVNIVDRFLSEKVVKLNRLQLVGITAMFIAAKYEEVLSPHVANFVHVADEGFTEEEILSAERYVLGALDYDLSYPNPMNFLRRISKADGYDIHSRTIGKYLIEISCLDHRFLPYNPSQVAAAAMYLARLILDRGEWDSTLTYYAGYTEQEIEPIVALMIDYLARPVIHEAFYKKYAGKRFMKSSILCRQWAKRSAPMFGIVDTHIPLDDLSP